MKKLELYNIWRKDYLLDDILIEQIILKNLNISKNSLFLLSEIENTEWILNDFEKYNSWYPIEYILWEAEFFWLNFIVDNRVLIPRNDTEIMVSKVLEEAKNFKEFFLIDVWTWSSCIPVSILKNLQNISKKAYVVDISEKALEVSKINIEKHWLQNEIIQVESDLLSAFLRPPLAPPYQGGEDNIPLLSKEGLGEVSTLIITANLPYIKNEDFDNMDNWVFFFEPNIALFGWKETWFELYEKLIEQIFELKKLYSPPVRGEMAESQKGVVEKIVLFIEIWFDQLEYSRKYLENLKLTFEYFKDMNNIERTIKITF